MFAQLLLYAKDQGYRWFNLGAAPLSGLADHPLASTWNRVGNLLYRHAENFYHFEGLKSFKQKFDPVWSPQYVCTRGGFALPTVLFDITVADFRQQAWGSGQMIGLRMLVFGAGALSSCGGISRFGGRG